MYPASNVLLNLSMCTINHRGCDKDHRTGPDEKHFFKVLHMDVLFRARRIVVGVPPRYSIPFETYRIVLYCTVHVWNEIISRT